MKKILSFVIVCAMMLGMLSFVSFADEQTMQVLPFNEGMENWPGGTGGTQTQILICPKDADGNKIAAAYTDTAAEWTITLTPETGDAKTVKLTQTSQYDGGDWGIIRFEPCLAEGGNQFIPVKDMKYTVTASFTSGGTTYTGTSDAGAFYLPGIDPVVPGVEPEITWPGTMTLVPKFGGAENWRGSTWLLLGPTCDNEDFKTVVGPKIKDGTYDVKYVVTDETTGEKYIMENYFFDHDDKTTWAEPNGVGVWNWTEVDTANTLLRLCASDYGIPVVVGHTYTVTGEVTEAGELKYNITSATGAFVPADGKFPATAGPAEGFVPPHSYTTEEDVTPDTPVVPDTPVDPEPTPDTPVDPEPTPDAPTTLGGTFEGTEVTWELKDGVLTIAGTGAMPDYRDVEDTRPWIAELETITKVVVKSGVTHLGSSSFTKATGVTEVVIEEGVETIGQDAFSYVGTIDTMYLPKSLTKIGQGVVYSTAVTTVNYAGTEDDFAAIDKSAPYNDSIYTGAGASAGVVFEVEAPTETPDTPVVPTGDATVYAIVFAIVSILGMGVVVTKKVRA